VLTGEAIHAPPKEHATDVRCDLVNKVEPVHVLIIIGVVPADAAVRNVADGVIEPSSYGLTNHVLGGDGDQVSEHVIIRPVYFEPLLGPDVERGHSRSE